MRSETRPSKVGKWTEAALRVLRERYLIGINRGEVMRLWIFLACFFQIPAAYACAALEDRRALPLVLATSVVSIVVGTAVIGFVVA